MNSITFNVRLNTKFVGIRLLKADRYHFLLPIPNNVILCVSCKELTKSRFLQNGISPPIKASIFMPVVRVEV